MNKEVLKVINNIDSLEQEPKIKILKMQQVKNLIYYYEDKVKLLEKRIKILEGANNE